jgi:hypothetical protein
MEKEESLVFDIVIKHLRSCGDCQKEEDDFYCILCQEQSSDAMVILYACWDSNLSLREILSLLHTNKKVKEKNDQ